MNIKINWKLMILVVFIFSLVIFGYKEYQKNIKYEKYLSQELFNSYSELKVIIFTIKEVLTSLLTSQADSNTKTVLADHLQRTSMLTQELDYYISIFKTKDDEELKNKSSLVTSNFAYFFQQNDANTPLDEDIDKMNSLNEMIETWMDVIINEYPGITNENKYEILYEENKGGDIFIRNHKWKSIITSLDRVSRNYEGVSQN
ncbi:hypothetical protein [Paenibacillus woosongensis]|uniref:Uncharacterized protein n=1 Tax=Paenibacillus woosongensis TaxID=307580 RepID=A0A7X2YXI0_9BACL|nr:hypothetical protein [Paenibacillus woosongensis]MUG43565.1 hypothetical protein [Paenibacillus woosongensis]